MAALNNAAATERSFLVTPAGSHDLAIRDARTEIGGVHLVWRELVWDERARWKADISLAVRCDELLNLWRRERRSNPARPVSQSQRGARRCVMVRSFVLLGLVAACAPAPPAPHRRGAHPLESAPGVPLLASVADATPSARESSSAPPVAPPRPVTTNTSVLLFGTPGPWQNDPLRFQPIACSVSGMLDVGKACAAPLGDSPKVDAGKKVLMLRRLDTDFHDEAGDQTYRAPLGPACCMYNTCVGETVPYGPPLGTAAAAKVVAVWPEKADTKLSTTSEAGIITDPKWKQLEVDEWSQAGGRRVAALSKGKHTQGRSMSGELWLDDGGGWRKAEDDGHPGADSFDILSMTDLDGDGRFEVFVYVKWVNDFGVVFYGNDWTAPAYAFSCGNI